MNRTPIRGTLLCMLLACACASAQDLRTVRHAASGIEFVWIDKGCFAMGAEKAGNTDHRGSPPVPRPDEVPRHEVCVDGFWMGRHEVTRAQWQRVMTPGAPVDAAVARHPATHVSWEDAQAFLQRLNATAGPGERFRLPTEVEWEFACRPGEPVLPIDGMRVERFEALRASAWLKIPLHEDQATRPVGELKPNPLGLYDMLGNVWEWTADVYLPDGYARHARRNPVVESGSDRHVLRGGSFKSDVTQARCGARAYGIPQDRLYAVGLRVVRQASAKQE